MPHDYYASYESYKGSARKLLEDDEKVLELIKKALDKLDGIPVIGSALGDIPLLCMVVSDYVTKKYTEFPLASIVGIVAALLYFASPIDLIPDFIPVAGYVDDIAILGFALKAVDNDLQNYRIWKGL